MAEVCELITGKRASITLCGKTASTQKQIYRCKISTQWELAMILPLIIPYLVGKKRQAEIALDFCKRKLARTGRPWYDGKEIDVDSYNECLRLNNRGTKEPIRVNLKLVAEN
jgi:hypothetical protein